MEFEVPDEEVPDEYRHEEQRAYALLDRLMQRYSQFIEENMNIHVAHLGYQIAFGLSEMTETDEEFRDLMDGIELFDDEDYEDGMDKNE